MRKFKNLPKHTVLSYRLNDITGWYHLTACTQPGFTHLPEELKKDTSTRPYLIKQQATQYIRGRQKHYTKFFTGLRKTAFPNIFIGDNSADRPSAIIFQFLEEGDILKAVYFGGHKVLLKGLKKFITTIKTQVLDEEVIK